METIVVKDLLQFFETKLRLKNEYGVGAFAGEGPKFPMVVVYLGEESFDAHNNLFQTLARIWPPYKDKICYLGVNDKEDDLDFCLFSGYKKGVNCDRQDVNEIINSLFETGSHFHDFNRLLVYFLLDSTFVKSTEEFEKWKGIICRIREIFMVENQITVLNVLLNEKFGQVKYAKNFRYNIGKVIYEPDEKDFFVNSVFLVSNRRNDGAILENWDLCCRIIADIIVLSNNHDSQIAKVFFTPTVKTVGYAFLEKPLQNISQIVIAAIIKQLNLCREKIDVGFLLEDVDIAKKLGITQNGTFEILDKYVEDDLVHLLPSVKELELFPRANSNEESQPVSSYLASKFDELTMGAWNCYLLKISNEAEQKIFKGKREQCRQDYQKLLRSNFTVDELVVLADNRAFVESKFRSLHTPSNIGDVLTVAKSVLKYNLSANDNLINFFIDTLIAECENTKKFVDAWTHLNRSLNTMFNVNNDNLSKFYEKCVQSFFDKHGYEIKLQFSLLNNVEQLWKFLTQIIEQMINYEPIYSEPFEDELQRRMDTSVNPVDSRSYIRTHLTGDKVKTYLHVSYALDRPILSAILLKDGTQLYSNLNKTLDANTYYYNTGCVDAAEAIKVYEVERTNLLYNLAKKED